MELPVCKDSDLKPGGMTVVSCGTLRVAVFRLSSGELSALEDKCSHAEVRLSGGKFEGAQIECSAHGARFDVRTGKALCMPAVAPVKQYETKIVGGNIVVVLP